MPANKNRLDRFISSHPELTVKRRDVRRVLAQGRVCVDGVVATEINQVVHEFSHITLDAQTLQANSPVYLMLHKPKGVVSATRDEQHQTVVDLLAHSRRDELHLVGRLDFNTTGLLLLTNDGRWSRHLMHPENKVAKVYRVKLASPVTPDYIEAFAAGMYFAYEDITTLPAKLEIVGEYEARVTLMEGRYHQVKRMFARMGNKVLELHRESVGGLALDATLAPGQSRALSEDEVWGLTPVLFEGVQVKGADC